jgi:hypothetical protein
MPGLGMIHGRKHSAEPRRFTRRQRGEIGEAPTDSTISPVPPARTGRKGRKRLSALIQVEAKYGLVI